MLRLGGKPERGITQSRYKCDTPGVNPVNIVLDKLCRANNYYIQRKSENDSDKQRATEFWDTNQLKYGFLPVNNSWKND